MKIKIILGLAIALSLAPTSLAKPSINDMQGCQAVIDFVDMKLKSTTSIYSASDIETVRTGLDAYNAYIQSEIVTSGLLEFNNGDKDKADAMQTQIDDYKASLVKGYAARYTQDKLFTDFAVAINKCVQQAAPSGDDMVALKASVTKIIELAQKS